MNAPHPTLALTIAAHCPALAPEDAAALAFWCDYANDMLTGPLKNNTHSTKRLTLMLECMGPILLAKLPRPTTLSSNNADALIDDLLKNLPLYMMAGFLYHALTTPTPTPHPTPLPQPHDTLDTEP